MEVILVVGVVQHSVEVHAVDSGNRTDIAGNAGLHMGVLFAIEFE